MEMDLKTKIEVLPCSKCEDMIDCESCYLQKEAQELYEQIRAEVIEKFKDSLIDYIANEKAKGNDPYWAVAIRNVAEQLKEQNK